MNCAGNGSEPATVIFCRWALDGGRHVTERWSSSVEAGDRRCRHNHDFRVSRARRTHVPVPQFTCRTLEPGAPVPCFIPPHQPPGGPCERFPENVGEGHGSKAADESDCRRTNTTEMKSFLLINVARAPLIRWPRMKCTGDSVCAWEEVAADECQNARFKVVPCSLS